MTNNMRLFFSGVKNPANVSDVRTALAHGYTIATDRVPTELLPCTLLLAVLARHTYKEQVVDEYDLLFQLTRQEYTEKPSPGFWHPQLFLVSSLAQAGPVAAYTLDVNQDAAYMFAVYEELRNGHAVGYLRGRPAKGAQKLQVPLPTRGQKTKPGRAGKR